MTKIDIFSGFLGAGKTTLIKKLLQEALDASKVVLIENEFGEIGIDGGFLKEAGVEIKEMNSGCICCSLVGDFGSSLKEVIEKYAPERILIEPSGVGKLSDVKRRIQLAFTDIGSPAQNNRPCMLNLIQEKFSEILCIHLAFIGIDHNNRTVKHNFCPRIHILNRPH